MDAIFQEGRHLGKYDNVSTNILIFALCNSNKNRKKYLPKDYFVEIVINKLNCQNDSQYF